MPDTFIADEQGVNEFVHGLEMHLGHGKGDMHLEDVPEGPEAGIEQDIPHLVQDLAIRFVQPVFLFLPHRSGDWSGARPPPDSA